MLEQAVSRKFRDRDKRMRTLLRSLQVFVLSMLILGEVFGMMLSRVYYETNTALFWQWVAVMLLFGVPMVLVAIALELPLRYLHTEYDYELQGQNFSVYRLVYGRRKWLLSVDLHSVTELRPYAGVDNGRKAMKAFCNPGDPSLVWMESNNCFSRRGTRLSSVVIEPDEQMRKALARECGGVARL